MKDSTYVEAVLVRLVIIGLGNWRAEELGLLLVLRRQIGTGGFPGASFSIVSAA